MRRVFLRTFFSEVFYISTKELLINEEIRAEKVRVIAADGSQLGILSLKDALSSAHEAGLDLVEMSPNAEPPVCKIMDYGKFLYEKTKKEKESKKKRTTVELKEI